MNAAELVAKGYYLSGVVSRELETVTGSQQADGLDMLNDILNEAAARGAKIPYYSRTTFTAVIGQEEYFIEGLMDIATLTFENGTIRYPMKRLGRDKYFGSSRTNALKSYPTIYTFDRALDGGKLYIYFFPSQAYPFQITGKYFLDNVTAGTDIDSIVDGFYRVYLKYKLDQRIRSFFDIDLNPGHEKILTDLEKQVFQVDPPDMRANAVSAFNANNGTNYAAANLFRGFWPT
jgi:hypothetical protein